jgi:hypothetical protein
VYALLTALEESKEKSPPSFFVAKYKDDGSVDSFFKLGDVPEGHIQPLRFAVFRDGSLLVTGTAVEGDQFRAFAATLDRSGAFVTGVKLPHDVEPTSLKATVGAVSDEEDPAAVSTAGEGAPQEAKRHAAVGKRKAEASPVSVVSNGSTISAPDGNVYVLRPTDPARLYVVSPSGEVVRQFEIPSPAHGLTPIHMAMAGDDKVFIRFAHVATGSAESDQAAELISVVSPQTGDVTGVYRLGEGESGLNIAACATSSYSFAFVGATGDGKHLQLVRYSPR